MGLPNPAPTSMAEMKDGQYFAVQRSSGTRPGGPMSGAGLACVEEDDIFKLRQANLNLFRATKFD